MSVDQLDDLRKAFKECLNELLPSLLAPDNLILKTIEGRKINAAEFVQYIGLYVDKFNSGKMPKPSSFMDANAEMSHKLAFEDAIKQYKERMNIMFGTQAKALDPAVLLQNHNVCVEEALTRFRNYPKFRNDDMTASYETKMKEKFNRLYDLYKTENNKKEEFNKMKDHIEAHVNQIKSLRKDIRTQEDKINDIEQGKRYLEDTIENLRYDAVHNRDNFSKVEDKYEKMDQIRIKQQEEIVELIKKNQLNQAEIMQLQQSLKRKNSSWCGTS